MFERGVAIVYASRRAAETALKIREALAKADVKSQVFATSRNTVGNVSAIKGSLREFVGDAFRRFDAIVAVMASGIIIRAMAPFLKSKFEDPAVVCVDVAGRFAISLTSGHYGGGNKLAKIIAKGISAIPVITTASESIGKKSVEEIAESLHCNIVNSDALTAINALIVNDAPISLIFLGSFHHVPKSLLGYKVGAASSLSQVNKILEAFAGAVVISKAEVSPDAFSKPVVVLKPKTVALGLGFRRNVDAEAIVRAVKLALKRAGVPLALVPRVATVDIKRGSRAIREAAERLGLELLFFSPGELNRVSHEDLSPESDIVKRHLGIGGVCERAALLAVGGNGRLILKKMRVNGVTVAVAEEK
ncbi:cobalamin biosynthesis protein [Candidatus Bathyarchaeota archaeon]|nr:cobalamin biosynthesis protein [Candidatus Bathyarchaeota archaeon]